VTTSPTQLMYVHAHIPVWNLKLSRILPMVNSFNHQFICLSWLSFLVVILLIKLKNCYQNLYYCRDDFSFFPLKIVFWKLLDTHFEKGCRWLHLFTIESSLLLLNFFFIFYERLFLKVHCIFKVQTIVTDRQWMVFCCFFVNTQQRNHMSVYILHLLSD
jgi:hypothetical protein